MKFVRQSLLVSGVLLLMAVSFTGSAFADWAATLVWKKEIGGCGDLQFCDDGPYLLTYDGDDLRRVEFYDWSGDQTGVAIDFTGRTLLNAYMDEGPVFAVETYNDSDRVTRFATYDRSGTMLFEIIDQDSLSSIICFMVSGSGRFFSGELVALFQEQVRVFEADATPICSILVDSVGAGGLSQDGERLYFDAGHTRWSTGIPMPYLKVYSVEGCSLMYSLPRHHGILCDWARDADVVAQWIDSTLTVYSGGISQGTLGNTVAFTLSPNGGYLVGHTQAADRIRVFRLDTMTQMWEILDTDDDGLQLPAPFVANNGVVLYTRRFSDAGNGITAVSPDGVVLYEEDFLMAGAGGYLASDGTFFMVQDCETDSVSYYQITE